MSDIASIQHIRRLLAEAEQGRIEPPETSAWVATWLRTWIAGKEAGCRISLETVGDLGAPGRPNWINDEARSGRDIALRELHRRHFSDLAPRAAARAILAMKPCPVQIQISERQLANILGK